MTNEDLELGKRLNAVCAYMGGPEYVHKKHWNTLMKEEVGIMNVFDLKFNESWSWLIPVWSKIRHSLTPMMVIKAITCIDEDNISELFEILSQVCIDWCRENNIKLD